MDNEEQNTKAVGNYRRVPLAFLIGFVAGVCAYHFLQGRPEPRQGITAEPKKTETVKIDRDITLEQIQSWLPRLSSKRKDLNEEKISLERKLDLEKNMLRIETDPERQARLRMRIKGLKGKIGRVESHDKGLEKLHGKLCWAYDEIRSFSEEKAQLDPETARMVKAVKKFLMDKDIERKIEEGNFETVPREIWDKELGRKQPRLLFLHEGR